jgi:arylsulfatase A-like enzyme
MTTIKKYFEAPIFKPGSLILSTTLVILLYVFMDWLFIISQPSFMNAMLFGEQVLILLNTAALLSLICLLAFVPYLILDRMLKGKTAKKVLRTLFAIIPAFVFTTMVLLFIDNYTYNLLDFGVVTSHGVACGIYTAGFVLLFIFLVTRITRFTNNLDSGLRKKRSRKIAFLIPGVTTLLVLFALVPVFTNPNWSLFNAMNLPKDVLKQKPNIILITADSLNAEKMSAYGFTNETTPFLELLVKSSLVAENHFSNAQGTIGSLSSTLSGRYPADIRMLVDEDILRDEDAYQHLPLILKRYGYSTAQLSYSYYADAGNLNLLGGFDLANDEETASNPIVSTVSAALPTDYYYFLRDILLRAGDRLGHIFFIKVMENPYKQMTESPEEFNDRYKLATVFSMLENSKQPLFVHLHWMGTHGPKYYPDEQVFSSGKDPELQGNREEDFYLDSILEFDQGMAQLYDVLVKTKQIKNTILIITSDHSQRWSVSRLPLIMRFPYGQHRGRIEGNTENLDIAPTILEYLGQPKPDWMAGQSLLSERDADGPVFIAQIGDADKDPETGEISYPEPEEPFFQFGRMTVVLCDTWYTVNLKTLKMTSGKVKSYSGTCNAEPSPLAALNLIRSHMQSYGFDAFSLYRVTLPR